MTCCGPDTYQTMYGEILDFQCQHQQWQHKIPDWKINFCSKFAIKASQLAKMKKSIPDMSLP